MILLWLQEVEEDYRKKLWKTEMDQTITGCLPWGTSHRLTHSSKGSVPFLVFTLFYDCKLKRNDSSANDICPQTSLMEGQLISLLSHLPSPPCKEATFTSVCQFITAFLIIYIIAVFWTLLWTGCNNLLVPSLTNELKKKLQNKILCIFVLES